MKEAEREDIENDSDVDFHFLNANEREIRLYDVQDIQKELEELTEDELDYARSSSAEREHINIKRKIKMNFKRNLCAPSTTESFYRIGRVLGKGAFGKVNLACQKLSRKICAVKSINKLYI
jgi:serine/threonine protein kinase